MKKINVYVNEAKDSNLHQFVQYLKDTGKEGELKSKVNSVKKLFDEADLDKCVKFNNCCIDDCWAFDEYMQSINLDPYKDQLEDWDGYFDYCKKIMEETILDNLDINNDGCIYIEREIIIPSFSAKTDLYKKFKEKYDGSLGKYWTYLEGNALQQNGGHMHGDEIVIKGYVRPEDVNWAETIASNIVDPDENELTIIEDSDIFISEIVTSKYKHAKHTIYKGSNLLYKA